MKHEAGKRHPEIEPGSSAAISACLVWILFQVAKHQPHLRSWTLPRESCQWSEDRAAIWSEFGQFGFG